MHHIMYISTATVTVNEATLKEMLVIYRRNNLRNGITGLLLYSGDQYVQLIEGEEEAVHQLFSKIENDPLHKNLLKLADGPIQQRLFHEWSMGFKTVRKEDFSCFSSYIDPSKPDFLHTLQPQYEDSAILVLQQFVQQNLSDIHYL